VFVTDSSTTPVEAYGETDLLVGQLGATAGLSRTIGVGQSLRLGGDPTAFDGAPPYVYSWRLSQNPAANGSLEPQAVPNPTFVADAAGEYTAELVVTDATGCSATRSIDITVVEGGEPAGDAGGAGCAAGAALPLGLMGPGLALLALAARRRR
jgi:hypothetical protein